MRDFIDNLRLVLLIDSLKFFEYLLTPERYLTAKQFDINAKYFDGQNYLE